MKKIYYCNELPLSLFTFLMWLLATVKLYMQLTVVPGILFPSDR